MIKKIVLFVIIVALIGIALIYFFGSGVLNKGIKLGVEKFGPQMTQTPVQLDAVDVSILSGNGTLTGLYVGNPDGYKSEHIFALGQIDIDLDPKSVFSDRIIINQIYIRKPEISYEKTLLSSNLKELIENIENYSDSAEQPPKSPVKQDPAAQDAPSKQVLIEQLIIEEGTIFVGLMGSGTTVALPRIEMHHIGQDGNRQSMAALLEQVLRKVLQSIGPAIADADELISKNGKAILDSAGAQGESMLKQANENIKGLFRK